MINNIQPYQQRRQQLQQTLSHGIAVIPTRDECMRNGGTDYPYRHDSSFYYLTGFNEPEAVLVLIAGDQPQSILFCRPKNLEREIWDGFRYGPDAAKEIFGFDACYPIEQFDEQLVELMGNQNCLYYPIGQSNTWDQRLIKLRAATQAKVRAGIQAPNQLSDITALINEMRLIKDEHELGLMRKAAQISTQAHQRAMKACRSSQYEYQIEAEILHEFCRHGARFPAYGSIVAAGKNACVLHYVENNAPLHTGDLLLIDAGCEYQSYAADITRTFPINGQFSPAQKALYQLVLDAQYAAIDAVKIGNHWNAPHEAALKVLAQGFIDLKLCQGSLDQVLETESYKQFYMHRTGHWLGMDVHDVGNYKQQGNWRPLQAGMVLTVEPGCYIRPADHVPEAFWHIGIRIEDDVLVTNDKAEILTEQAPKTIAEIETWMSNS